MMGEMRQVILTLFYPLIKFIGRVSINWFRRDITARMVTELVREIKPGDIIISKAFWNLTNILIPGTYKHSGVVSYDCENIIEAIDPRVRKTTIWDFCLSKDRLIIVRNRWGGDSEKADAARLAEAQIGKKYDYSFDMPSSLSVFNPQFYCHELSFWSHAIANGKNERHLETLDKIWDERTVVADSFLRKPKDWEVIWSSH